MRIYPAIDLFGGKAVRLYKGDYNQMTVYSDNPVETALDFKHQGAECVHLVDLEGARSGETPNLETVCRIKAETQLFCEVGGGVRSMDVVVRYAEAGLDRVILGTAAVNDPGFLRSAVQAYGGKIAVVVDIRDGCVAVKGWTEKTCVDAFSFCEKMQDMGVETLICTDISRDGAMQGANVPLYQALGERFAMRIIASSGAGCIEDFIHLFKTLPRVDAGLAASIFHFGEVQIDDLKRSMAQAGIPARLC